MIFSTIREIVIISKTHYPREAGTKHPYIKLKTQLLMGPQSKQVGHRYLYKTLTERLHSGVLMESRTYYKADSGSSAQLGTETIPNMICRSH
jgi:hypothetical protein